MAARTSAVARYDFINPQTLANLFVTRTAAGSVSQNEDHVRITDNGLLTLNLTAGPGVDATLLKSVEILARAAVSPLINGTMFLGLADAAGADQDYTNLSNYVGFIMAGTAAGGALSVQAKHGSVDSGVMAVGTNFGTSWQRFRLNLVENTVSKGPPATSGGGRANVKASVDNSDGYRREVAVSTALDIEGYSGRLQPVIMFEGAVMSIDVREICLEYNAT